MLVAAASTDMPHAISRALERGGCPFSSTRPSWTRRQLTASQIRATRGEMTLRKSKPDDHFSTSYKRGREKKRIGKGELPITPALRSNCPSPRLATPKGTRSFGNLPIARDNRRFNDTPKLFLSEVRSEVGLRLVTFALDRCSPHAGLSPLSNADYYRRSLTRSPIS